MTTEMHVELTFMPGQRVWFVERVRDAHDLGACPACGGSGKRPGQDGQQYRCGALQEAENEDIPFTEWWCEHGRKMTTTGQVYCAEEGWVSEAHVCWSERGVNSVRYTVTNDRLTRYAQVPQQLYVTVREAEVAALELNDFWKRTHT